MAVFRAAGLAVNPPEVLMARITGSLFAVGLALCGAVWAPAESPPATGPYHVAEIFRIGGAGGWDYVTVDPEHRHLYLPRSTHTMVLDAATGKRVADIPGQKRNHGVALVPRVGRGFITDGKDGSVTIFDLKTFKVLGRVEAADDADGIIYDPASGKLLVSCGDAGVLVPIAPDVDPRAGRADAAVPLGGKPEFLVADGKGKVFINLVDKDQVAVVDTRAMKVVAKWPTAPGGAPVGLSMDPERGRLFVGCRKPQKLIVMSPADGKILADLPIGAGVDATQFDNGHVFASCRDGSLAIARETSPGKFKIVQNLKTRPGARTMAIDPTTHTVFLPTAEFGEQKDARSRPIARPETFMVLVVRPSKR
jgi:DNA-binding beta-propeller fold protein YncE